MLKHSCNKANFQLHENGILNNAIDIFMEEFRKL